MRLATWNIWGRLGPWPARESAIATTLVACDPDLVGLQECWVSRDDSAAQRLAAQMGRHWVLTDSRPEQPGEIGNANAVLSRYPILSATTHQLPLGPDRGEERWLLDVVVAAPRGPLRFATTHLNWRANDGATRVRQARAAAELLRDDNPGSDYPTILTGDFNGGPETDEIRLLTGAASHIPIARVFLDAWDLGGTGLGTSWAKTNPHTRSDPAPGRRLDYVFVGFPVHPLAGWVQSAQLAGTEPVATGLAGTDTAVVPSDHYMVVVEISD
jgi:endonuclease/exonuclease/phosphatase family metal-dependent hydrolase